MKKLYIPLIILYLLNLTVYADDNILKAKAGNIYPISDKNIQMISEKVEIKVRNGMAYVRSEFVLKNTGEKEKIIAGFPAYTTKNKNHQLHDFKVYIDGEKTSIALKKGENRKELYNDNWYALEMTFDKEQVKRVENTYWVDLAVDGIGGEKVEYILSGGVWDNPIGYGKVTIEFEDDLDPENVELVGYEDYKNYVSFKVIPEDKKMTWEFYNLKPDFDINLYHKNSMKNEKTYLLDIPIAPRDEELWEIQNLGKKAYDTYKKENYDDAWRYMDQIEKYKENEEDRIAKYAIRMIHLFDYYRAMILMKKGQYEDAAYYFKTNGIFEEKNLYQLAMLYKKSGYIDEYIEMLKGLEKGKRDGQVIKIWVKQEMSQLPSETKEKYEISQQLKKEKKTDKPIKVKEETKKEKFSYRGFILFNMGILILVFVVFWNIKRRS
ncbi:MAG: hypothetical protein N4A62_13750 [Marinisporobacter sp.]|jgi:hypothetical protein|nr:hypothetical protein [Marinisporobacter sp.]